MIPTKTSAVKWHRRLGRTTRRLNIWLMTQSKKYLPSMDIGWNHTGCVQTAGQCKHRKMPEPMFGHEGPPVAAREEGGGGERGHRRARNRVGELMWSAEIWRLRGSSSQWSFRSTSREVKFTSTPGDLGFGVSAALTTEITCQVSQCEVVFGHRRTSPPLN